MIYKVVLLFSIIMIMAIKIWKDEEKNNKKIMFLMIAYIYCIFLFTMSGRVGMLGNNTMNLIPGKSLYIMLSSPWNDRGGYEFVEAMGNILLFIPMGMVLRKWAMCSYKIIIISSLLLTLFIEYMQYFFSIGTFEIDDVLNNIWGCLVGANLVYILNGIRKRSMFQRRELYEWGAMVLLLVFDLFALSLYFRFLLGLGVVL